MSDVFIVIHLSTTCDENGVYVTKDSAEVIELAWILLDANTLEELDSDSVLVRPVNTPITALCTSLTTLTWEHVRNAGTFRDAVLKLDQFIHDKITSKALDFTFVTLNAWDLRVQLPREARDKSVVLPPYLQHSRCFDLKQEYAKWQAHHPETLSYSSSNLSSICTALEVELEHDASQAQQIQAQPPQEIQPLPQQASFPGQVLPSQSQPQTQQPGSGPNGSTPVSATGLKPNIPFHLQQSSIQAPRRALDEAAVLEKVLKSLIKKSTPLEDHSDVLTRPFDGRADVRAFLAERSKVLHLNNLPQDTTQSELESWFTQYGGRPIAFWTLKTPEQHKPTGLGFAVFSSHEEAAESLAMNGRALNDRSIEVQPSSARVLDRAQEILTPFPPSKNRPRPGDWTCPSCGFSNFQRRTACFRCSFPAASAAAIQESMYSSNGNTNSTTSLNSQAHSQAHNGNNNNNNNSHHNNHSSNHNNNNHHNHNNHGHNNNHHNSNAHHQNGSGLSFINNNATASAVSNNGSNISHNNQFQNSHGNGNGNGNNHNNGNGNNGNNGNNNSNNNNNNGNRMSSVPFRAGDWKCGNEGCSYHNFAKNICCLKCGAPRVQSNISHHLPDSNSFNQFNNQSVSQLSQGNQNVQSIQQQPQQGVSQGLPQGLGQFPQSGQPIQGMQNVQQQGLGQGMHSVQPLLNYYQQQQQLPHYQYANGDLPDITKQISGLLLNGSAPGSQPNSSGNTMPHTPVNVLGEK